MKSMKEWQKEVEQMRMGLYNWGVDHNSKIKIGRYVFIGLFIALMIYWRSR